MKKALLKTITLFTLIFSMITVLVLPGTKVSASSTETNQTYITIQEISREDNEIHFTIKDNIKIKDITYERVYELNGEKVSDLISDVKLQKGFGNNEYKFDIEPNTLGVKIWKIKHQEQVNYYKSKFTKGQNVVGDVVSKSKKNYMTVTADKLVAYEFSTKNLDIPWYLWSPVGISTVLGDYLFNQENSASYIWYFNLDTKIDKIESLSLEYATFTYTEAMWGVLESKHDYKTHQTTIDSEMSVYDYKKFSKVAREECGNQGVCNNALFDKGKEFFQHKAFGVSDEEDFDWYVQVSLNDLLKENNVLWGAYENHDYLQEVSLIKIAYWTNGEYFEDVPVLDEDTGELIVKADDSPIDLIVKFLDNAKKWIEKNIPLLMSIGIAIIFVACMPLIIRLLSFLNRNLKSVDDALNESLKKKEKV